MQEIQVQFPIQEDHTCPGAVKPVHRNPGAHVQQLLEPTGPRACAPYQEKPPQWEGCTPQLESGPRSSQRGKSPHRDKDPNTAKNNNK